MFFSISFLITPQVDWKKTLHASENEQDVIKMLRKRVVKIGIETCTVIVDRDEDGNVCNPRIPIVFRKDTVAEYPSFSMVVPSGAYQAGLLTKSSGEDYYSKELEKRLDWRVSVLRELGEELFHIDYLERYNIEELMESVQYKLCQEITEDALYFEATGFGIDMYIGSGGLLTTLVLEYDKVLKIMNNYENTSENIQGLSDNFILLNKRKADDTSEGWIYMFNLDSNLIDHVVSNYMLEKPEEPLKPIAPINHGGHNVEFLPMIPSGVLSIMHAKEILSDKFDVVI